MLLFAVSALLPVLSAFADDVDRVRELRDTQSIRPLTQIMQSIERKYPGTLLEVELEEEDGKIIYEIDILGRDQVVHHIEVNARSGAIVAVDKDD